MQIQRMFLRQKELGIHPDVQFRVVDIPQYAPEEVKRIMNVTVPGVGPSSMKCKLDPARQLIEQLEIAKKLKEKGYNPLDYKLDVEEITLKLKQMKATREYSLLQKFSQIYETGRGCPEAIRQVYNDALRRCSESQEAIPTYKRILKRKVNPFTAEIERTKATLDELAHKLSECVLVKERAAYVNKALKTIMK